LLSGLYPKYADPEKLKKTVDSQKTLAVSTTFHETGNSGGGLKILVVYKPITK
jgi:hypothetical protein